MSTFSNKATATAIAIDNNVLVRWITALDGSETKKKLDYFFETLQKNNQQLIIPAPVVAEFLVHAFDARYPFLEKLRRSESVKIIAFDFRAAMECAILSASAIGGGDKLYGGISSKQKIKVDEQIAATAKVMGVGFIVSDDKDIQNISNRFGISCKKIQDLELPPQDPQGSLLANI